MNYYLKAIYWNRLVTYREPVCFMESHFIEDNFSENFNSLK